MKCICHPFNFEPFYLPKWQLPLLFHTPEAWKRYSFHAEPPRTGHPHPPGYNYDLTLAFLTRGLKALFMLKALVPNKEVITGHVAQECVLFFFFLRCLNFVLFLSLVILCRRRNLTPVNPLSPKIKIWILICCPYSFPTDVVGEVDKLDIKQNHLVWSCP